MRNLKVKYIFAYAAIFIQMALTGPVHAQTPTEFNLTCAPQGSAVTGNDTFGDPLKPEDYQGIIDETKELAVDLKSKTFCHPRYCTPTQFGKPEPIFNISSSEIIFERIAAREVESNDYNIIAYQTSYADSSQTLSINYTFFGKDRTTPTGTIKLLKTCEKTAFVLIRN